MGVFFSIIKMQGQNGSESLRAWYTVQGVYIRNEQLCSKCENWTELCRLCAQVPNVCHLVFHVLPSAALHAVFSNGFLVRKDRACAMVLWHEVWLQCREGFKWHLEGNCYNRVKFLSAEINLWRMITFEKGQKWLKGNWKQSSIFFIAGIILCSLLPNNKIYHLSGYTHFCENIWCFTLWCQICMVP